MTQTDKQDLLPCPFCGGKAIIDNPYRNVAICTGCGGRGCGMGLKPSDEFCVPLSVDMHARQHRIGERIFWSDPDIAIELDRQLYKVTGNDEAGRILVRTFREVYFPWGME